MAKSRQRLASFLAGAGLLFGFWLLLVDSVDLAQLATGAVAAALGAAAGLIVSEHGRLPRPRARWALGLPALGVRAALDCAVLTRALARRLVLRRPARGRLRASS